MHFFRPRHALGGVFDGPTAREYFARLGYSKQGRSLAAGEDERGPNFRVCSGLRKQTTLVWGWQMLRHEEA